MKYFPNKMGFPRIILITLQLFIVLFLSQNCLGSYFPLEVKQITRDKADYSSPENTYISYYSAMMSEDYEWYLQSLSKDSLQREKKVQEQFGPQVQESRYAVFKDQAQTLILDKKPYKEGLYLLIKIQHTDGSSFQGPSFFVQENGLWKSQSNLSDDSELLDLIVYTPPPADVHPFNLSLFPTIWDLTWYNWIESRLDSHFSDTIRFVQKPSILCLFTQEDSEISFDDIELETLRLNHRDTSYPWSYRTDNPTVFHSEPALIFDFSEGTAGQKHYYQDRFTTWIKQIDRQKAPQGVFLLLRFSQYEAMQTLDNPQPGTEHEITISGKLKDGRIFEAKSTVTTLLQNDNKDNSSTIPEIPPGQDTLMENWWNK